MKLRLAHIVLISAAILMGIVLAAFGIHRYTAQRDTSGLALAAAGGMLAVGLAVYLRYFRRKPAAGVPPHAR